MFGNYELKNHCLNLLGAFLIFLSQWTPILGNSPIVSRLYHFSFLCLVASWGKKFLRHYIFISEIYCWNKKKKPKEHMHEKLKIWLNHWLVHLRQVTLSLITRLTIHTMILSFRFPRSRILYEQVLNPLPPELWSGDK